MATRRSCDECGKPAEVIYDVEVKASRMVDNGNGIGVRTVVPERLVFTGDLCDTCVPLLAAMLDPSERGLAVA